MNRIFHSLDVRGALKERIQRCQNSITVITAFCTVEGLSFVDCHTTKGIKKRLLVRFRKEDILNGSTDFKIANYAKENNWEMKLDLNLHSKLYMFDSSQMMLGSANLTSKGLGLFGKGNIESVVCIDDLTMDEIIGVEKIYNQGIDLSEELLDLMTEQLENNSEDKDGCWSHDISNHFNKQKYLLWTNDLLFSPSPNILDEHDRLLLDLPQNYSQTELKIAFRRLKIYRWFYELLMHKEFIYFGELTARLHESLLDDPKPYRKDVKVLVKNLIVWLENLDDQIIVDRPNYSQRIMKTSSK